MDSLCQVAKCFLLIQTSVGWCSANFREKHSQYGLHVQPAIAWLIYGVALSPLFFSFTPFDGEV